MPKLSLWRNDRSNDYRYQDRLISERYEVGGLDIAIHKYLGVKTDPNGSGDATLPTYSQDNPLLIEDLLLLENRNRNYAEDVYTLRGVYNVQDLDFDLSQFGLFLQNDTLFVTFHYNDMIDRLGRKLMNGDVLEIPNLKDFHPLNPDIPVGLPKFYVVNDASFASEGFGASWRPHTWRVKAVPLVGSQEYQDILGRYADTQGGIDGDDEAGNGSGTLGDWICQHQKNIDINDAIVTQAEQDVPLSGYDVSKFYITGPGLDGSLIPGDGLSADEDSLTADSGLVTADRARVAPVSAGYAVGYLTGDGEAPNDAKVSSGTAFPVNPSVGDYALRLDYQPNRLFRYNGSIWVHIEDDVRTELTPGPNNLSQRSRFVNNTDVIDTADRGTIPSRQALNELLSPEDDN